MDIRRAIVRIPAPDGGAAGTGFFASDDGLVVTCAHVIERLPQPVDVVELQVMPERRTVKARLVGGCFRASCAEDIAVLRVVDHDPTANDFLQFCDSATKAHREFESFGFPLSFGDNGLPAAGEVLALTEFQGFPFLSVACPELTLGFSGAPAIDRDSRLVVGVVAVVAHPDALGRLATTALLIPAATVLAISKDVRCAPNPAVERYAAAVTAAMSELPYSLPIPAKFASRVPPVVPQKLRTPGASEAPFEATRLFSRRDATPDRAIVVTGPPGGGKSTLLRHVAANAWSRPHDVGLSDRHVPIYLRLRSLAGVEGVFLSDRIERALERDRQVLLGGGQPAISFHELLNDPDLSTVVLLDGYDEVDGARERQQVAHVVRETLSAKGKAVSVVLSSRPTSDLPIAQFNHAAYELVPFDEDQRRDLIEAWADGIDVDRYVHLFRRDDLKRLCANPLSLTIALCVVMAGGTGVPNTSSALYARIVDIWLEEWKRRGLANALGPDAFFLLPEALAEIALQGTLDPQKRLLASVFRRLETFFAEKLGVAEGVCRRLATQLLDFLTVQGGICYVDDGQIGWVHKNYEEYLVARALLRSIHEGRATLAEVLRYRSTARFRHAIIFLLGILSKEQLATAAELIGRTNATDEAFLAEAVSFGVPFSEDVRRDLAERLKDRGLFDFTNDPRSMCEKIVESSKDPMATFLSLSYDPIVRPLILSMISQTDLPAMLRQDILRHMVTSDYLASAEIEQLKAKLGQDGWSALIEMRELARTNLAFLQKAEKTYPSLRQFVSVWEGKAK